MKAGSGTVTARQPVTGSRQRAANRREGIVDEQSRERIKQEIRERGERRSALIERINILIRYEMIDAPSFSTHTECYTELDMIGMIYDAAINAKFSRQVNE